MEIENIVKVLEQIKQMEARLEKERAYRREYMRRYMQDPVRRAKQNARMIGLSYEEYVVKKSAGQIKQGKRTPKE
jgi:hypothetical protein